MKSAWAKTITQYIGVEPIEINSALVSAQSRPRLYWTNIPGVTQPEDRKILLRDILSSGIPLADKGYALDAYYYKNGKVNRHELRPFSSLRQSERRVCVKDTLGCVQVGTADDIKGHDIIRRVYAPEGKSPALTGKSGGNQEVKVSLSEKEIAYMNRTVADDRNPNDFGHHSDVEKDKSSTVVANFAKGVPYNVLKEYGFYRKLSPVECERLQTVPEGYTEGVSNTQRYTMLGNGWTVDVIAHIYSFLPAEYFL